MQMLLHKRVVFAVTLPYPLPEQSDVILLSKNFFSWFRSVNVAHRCIIPVPQGMSKFVTIVLTFDL